MSDQEIINEIRAGNTRIIKKLMKYYKPIKAFVLMNSGREEDARDLFQDVLIVFYKNARMKDFILSAKISTYLLAIARRIHLKKLRDNRKHRSFTEEMNEPELIENMYFELYAAKEQIIYRIDELLNQLGEICEKILIGFYYRKLGYEILARELGYQSGHVVRQQKYRCIMKLKLLIQSKDISRQNIEITL